jgi:protein-tyrosine phosphatase
MPSVLFVCTANICRSPMAMGLFRKKVSDQAGWQIESAGTWTIHSQPAASYTLQVLQHRDIDIYEHRSRPVSRELLAQFNLILTMEAGHKEALKVEFPAISDRVYMVSEMIGEHYDISDPIGEPYEEFERTAQELEMIFEKGSDRIYKLAEL